jgi:hypothetical protein
MYARLSGLEILVFSWQGEGAALYRQLRHQSLPLDPDVLAIEGEQIIPFLPRLQEANVAACILALDAMSVLLGLLGRLPDAWVGHLTTMNTVALASVAGVYGANSVVGAWRNVGEKVKHLLSTPDTETSPDFPDE